MKNVYLAMAVCTLVISSGGSVMAAAPAPIPEPGTFVLLGLGAAGLMIYKKIKK